MSGFIKYQHVERWGTDETAGIECGECYVFPKIDGTNGSLWWDNGLQAGSRNRLLSPDNDNQGFFGAVMFDERFQMLFNDHRDLRLFGEWLVPHSLKTYREDAWRKFYVFDVVSPVTVAAIHDETIVEHSYMHPSVYIPLLESYGIDVLHPLAICINPCLDQLRIIAEKNTYLMQDGHIGEGVVVKNYDFKNRWGRRTWAKIVRHEFKEKMIKAMGPLVIQGVTTVEIDVAEKYVTESLVRKELAKILSENDGKPVQPRLLSTVFHAILTEETWNFVKEHKNPTIDFKALQKYVYARVKKLAPEYF